MQYVYLNIIDFYKNYFVYFYTHTKNHNIPLYNTFNLFNKSTIVKYYNNLKSYFNIFLIKFIPVIKKLNFQSPSQQK